MLKYYLIWKILMSTITNYYAIGWVERLKEEGYTVNKLSLTEKIKRDIKHIIYLLCPVISTALVAVLVFKGDEKLFEAAKEKLIKQGHINKPEEAKEEPTFLSSEISDLCKKYDKPAKEESFIKILGYDQIKNTDDSVYKETIMNARETITKARETITNARSAASNARKSVLDSPVMGNSYDEYHKVLAAIFAQKTDDSIHTHYISDDSWDIDLCDLDEEIEKSFASENGDLSHTDCVPSDSGDLDLCDLDEEIEKSFAEDSLKGPKKSLHL